MMARQDILQVDSKWRAELAALLFCLAVALVIFLFVMATSAICYAQVFRSYENQYENHWLLRSFEGNIQKCSVRSDQPEWCREWIGAMNETKITTNDLTVPEWQRISFNEGMVICTTLLPPPWCLDWRRAMEETTKLSPYKDNVENYRERISADKIFRKAEELRWKALLERVSSGIITSSDISILEEQSNEGQFNAIEIFAWMQAVGVGVKRDMPRAYELYARAFLDGHLEVKKNMDIIWSQLKLPARNALRDKYR
ncbi:MAG: hypothetical protein WCK65_12315 [Rhodospirillaceae bacterium]